MGINSRGVAQSDRDKQIRKKWCQVLCNDRFDKVFWETKHSKPQFFYFAALCFWTLRKQCDQMFHLPWLIHALEIKLRFCMELWPRQRLHCHTPYNKVGIIFFIWVRPHWKSLTNTYLNLNTINSLNNCQR